ncbi:MAG: signal recognition particle-docking protein FtsY [Candidatus Bathyarchaeia archaeon]
MFEKLRKNLDNLYEALTKTELKGDKLRSILDEFRLVLIENDVAYEVADRLCEMVAETLSGTPVPRTGDKRGLVKRVFKETVSSLFQRSSSADLPSLIDRKREAGEPAVILFLGVNGTGKTTSIAKTARYLMRRGYTVVLASGDTYRTGSIEQLREHARRVGVKVIEHGYGSDSAAVAYDAIRHAQAHGVNAVLIDTAGRMQTDRNLMDEVAKVSRVAKPDMKVLVVDALTGNDAVEQCRVFNDAVGVDAVFLTKLDADAKGGAALSATTLINRPIIFVGTGQGYDDIAPFTPDFLLKSLFD